MHRSVVLVVASVAGIAFAGAAAAAQGDLDPTFGAGGIVRTDLGLFDDPSDLAVQRDGKIVAVGTIAEQGGTIKVFVVRYLNDGSLDPGFALSGILVTNRHPQVPPSLALQSDGKIVLATRDDEVVRGALFLYRFNGDGSPDAAFGTGGTASVVPPAGIKVNGIAGVAIAAGGKIVVCLRSDPTVAFARFNADGTLDSTFGTGGFVGVASDGLSLPLSFRLQPDRRMLVVGSVILPGRFFSDAFMARFDAAGGPDASFGTNGVALFQASLGTDFRAVALAPDGSIFTGGRAFGPIHGQSQWLLAGFTSAGILDPGFGSSGTTLLDFGDGEDVALDLSVTSAGIYVTGAIESGPLGLPVARFLRNGQMDLDFADGGLTGIRGQPTGGAGRLAVQADGKIIACGIIQSFVPTFNRDIYLARYEGPECPRTTVHFDLAPSTLNLRSHGRWMTGTLEPEPPASPADIDLGSIVLNGTIPVDGSAPASIGDADGDGIPDLTVKFDRNAVQSSVRAGPAVTVTVAGKIGSNCFEASDVILVQGGHVSAGGTEVQVGGATEGQTETFALHGAVPNPGRALSVSFSLSSSDPATLTILDVSGRMVRSLEVGMLGPGRHIVALGEPGMLAPGVYIVHLVQGGRRLTTRAVVAQ